MNESNKEELREQEEIEEELELFDDDCFEDCKKMPICYGMHTLNIPPTQRLMAISRMG
jgi:hypothetical protein